MEKDLDLLPSGKISQLSAQTELLMERLVSMSGSVSSASSVSQVTGPSLPVTPLSFTQVAATSKPTALPSSDIRRLPRLDGSPDFDVAAVLSQYRLVAGFKAKTVRPNYQEYADPLAFEYLWLICDGPVLTQYQQLSAGIIDWRVPLSLLVKPPTKRSALFPLWKRGPNFFFPSGNVDRTLVRPYLT